MGIRGWREGTLGQNFLEVLNSFITQIQWIDRSSEKCAVSLYLELRLTCSLCTVIFLLRESLCLKIGLITMEVVRINLNGCCSCSVLKSSLI